ncbi:hypothetical protein ADUPG1_000268, partial [Aduncisulcus paluster]
MIRVVSSLRKLDEDTEGKGNEGLIVIERALVHIVLIAEETVDDFKSKLIPQISSVLMRVVDEFDHKTLVDTIKKCSDSESTSKIYHEHRASILSVFLACQSRGEIEEHKREIVLCCQCLRWFVRHSISGKSIFLPIPDLNDLIDTFIDHISRVESILEGAVDEEYCWICTNYTFEVRDKRNPFLPKISPTFHRILERGSKEKLEGNVPKWLLMTFKNISNSSSSSTLSSIFTLIKPYVKDWMRIYGDTEYYKQWFVILKNLTWSPEDDSPNKAICSESWPFFHPILDFVKRECSGDKIVEKDYADVLDFFSNLCSDPSHVQEIYDNIKDLLDGWYEAVKKKRHEWGIKYWSQLISMLSTSPSLVPLLSPKYDTHMEWCKNNGGWESFCSKFFTNCYPHLKKWGDLIDTIKKCPDSESTSKLYHEHRASILSVFLACQSRGEIEEHKREIVLCCQCLRWFVCHDFSETIYLPISDMNDLIDTFIDHLSRVESILGAAVDEEYCSICLSYTFKVQDKWDSFFPKISPTFHRILDRGSKEKLKGNIPKWLLTTLRNISKSSSTRSSIFTLIKPYAKDWMRIYGDIEYYEEWMFI